MHDEKNLRAEDGLMQFGDLSEEQWQDMFGNWEDFARAEDLDLQKLQEMVQQHAADESSMDLIGCLEILRKEELKELIEDGGYAVKKSLNKAEMVAALAEAIRQRFTRFLQCMVLEDYYQLWTVLILDEELVTEDFIKENFFYHNQGFVYYFDGQQEDNEESGGPFAIMPVELQLQFVETINDQWMAEVEQRDLLFSIMKGLAFLYGSYPMEQLYKVWLHVVGEEEIRSAVLEKCCELIAMGKDELVLEGDYILWDEVLKDQKDLRLEGYDYYLPNLEEIMQGADGGLLDASLPQVQALTAFFQQQKQLEMWMQEEIMQSIHYLLKYKADQDECLQFIDDYLKEYGLDLTGKKDWEQLHKLIGQLTGQVRCWAYGGHRPADLVKGYTDGGTFRYAGEKVGRNDRCPCGSGKKYKQCCGK